MSTDNVGTVKEAADFGWDKDNRVLAYKGRTIHHIRRTDKYDGMYLVSYDCGQADLLNGNDRLDILVPLSAHNSTVSELASVLEAYRTEVESKS